MIQQDNLIQEHVFTRDEPAFTRKAMQEKNQASIAKSFVSVRANAEWDSQFQVSYC